MKKKDMKNDDMEFRDDRGTSFVYDGSEGACGTAGREDKPGCAPYAAEENAGYSEASDCSCHPCSSTETELSCRSGTGGRHDSHATGRSSSVHDARSDEHAEVALVKCESYDRAEVYQAVSAAVELLGGMENLIGLPKDSHIVLKPNLLTKADPEKACTTHPAVFEAAGRLLQEAGFSELCYGDSPGPSRLAPEKIAEECGLSGPADRLGIPFGDFEHGTEVRFPEGRAETRFVLCNEIARADGVVDICKMKTHQLERITGAVKNTFGCVYGFNKGASHARFATAETFARMIADLNDLVRPVLHIMDGVTAMEGNGRWIRHADADGCHTGIKGPRGAGHCLQPSGISRSEAGADERQRHGKGCGNYAKYNRSHHVRQDDTGGSRSRIRPQQFQRPARQGLQRHRGSRQVPGADPGKETRSHCRLLHRMRHVCQRLPRRSLKQ